MIYKKHRITLFSPECTVSLLDCPKDVIEYNDKHDKQTCVGFIRKGTMCQKIFMTWEGRNKNYKMLRSIVDELLKEEESE